MLQRIDQIAEAPLCLESGKSRDGARRTGLGTRPGYLTAELLGSAGEGIEGRLEARQHGTERSFGARCVRCGAKRSGAGEQPGRLLVERVGRVAPAHRWIMGPCAEVERI
jgi:hypothetical protein